MGKVETGAVHNGSKKLFSHENSEANGVQLQHWRVSRPGWIKPWATWSDTVANPSISNSLDLKTSFLRSLPTLVMLLSQIKVITVMLDCSILIL